MIDLEGSDLVAEMVNPRSEVPSPTQPARYGLGIWLHPSGERVGLHGSDAGVSFQTVYDASERFTHTVLSNTSEGAWRSSYISTSSSRGETRGSRPVSSRSVTAVKGEVPRVVVR